jgi:hypothetical protein
MKEKMILAMLLLPLLLCSYALAKDSPVLTLHGAIMDSQCAYNVHSLAHSHDWMVHKGVAGAFDNRSCTLHCVKDKGGVYVLLVKDDVYRLDDQDQSAVFAGKKIKVTGTLDEKTHTLHVLKMEEER